MLKKKKIIKKLKKSKAMREANEIDYAEDGKATITVGVKSADDLFNRYSYRTYELLNSDVVDYINTCESSIPKEDEIAIDIYTEEPTTNTEKKRIREAVKRHNAEQLVLIKHQLRKNFWVNFGGCVLGIIIMLLAAVFFEPLQKIYIQEILTILGWLFLWDGLEDLLTDQSELRRSRYRCIRLMSAKVHVRQYDRKIQKEYGFGEFEEDEEE